VVPATSERDATAATLTNHYSKRWTIEPQFHHTKDLRFGMGLSSTRISEPMRRDRLLLVSAFATVLLTLLGAVGEKPRHGPAVEVEHQQDADTLVVLAGLYALRTHPEHAGASARTADGDVRRSRGGNGAFADERSWSEMRGWVRCGRY